MPRAKKNNTRKKPKVVPTQDISKSTAATAAATAAAAKKMNNHCACSSCTCGPSCQCTESLCLCEASSVLNSLGQATCSNNNNNRKACCQQKKQYNGDPLANPAPAAAAGDIEHQGRGDSPLRKLQTLELSVLGMTCAMCSKSVTQALQSIESVTSATVSLPTNSATITYDSARITPQELAATIEGIGYEAILPPAASSSSLSSTSSSSSTNPVQVVVEFSVQGMTCSQCTSAVKRAIEAISGVKDISVLLSTNTARVEFDPSETSTNVLKETIEDIGYDVTDINILSQQGRGGQAGAGCSADDNDNDQGISEDRLERMLQNQQRQVLARKHAFLWSLIGTFPILIMTMVLPHLSSSKLSHFLLQKVHIGNYTFVLEALLLWALCTPIQFGSGWSFYRTSYHNLRMGVMGMDVLVVVGTSASYGYAVWATLAGSSEYHFFETSAVLICFVLLGKWLQTLAVRRTSQALTQLLALQPKTAIRIIPPTSSSSSSAPTSGENLWDPIKDTYEEHVVPLNAIQKGDLVKVLKGASIPADGIVQFGEMSVDESMITGESIPVFKTNGSVVLGGTVCAEAGQAAGATFVEVTGVGASTALSQIVKLVQDAQNRQVPIQSLADTISTIFVPTVVTISVITFMIWYAAIQSHIVPSSYLPEGESPATFSLLFGIACLVISCPCALGLATPTAVMVGTGVGAKQGILMKGGDTLQLASQVNSVVFDKTGTLTQGKPAITDFSVLVTDSVFWEEIVNDDKVSSGARTSLSTKEHLLWLLGSLERNSEHPLASAIVSYAEECLQGRIPFVQPTNFVALTGRGASGTIEGKTSLAVGNRAFCQLNEVKIDRQVEDAMQRIERQGKTAIVAVVNGTVCVVMGIADQLKPDAVASISYLRKKMDIDVWMVTGDNRRTARAIARKLGLPMDRVIAEALPVAKVEKVQELQQQGRIVAMVGDGVNDSPALAQADVGLSLGSGAEIAAEASDMVLVKGNVADVCTALDLSQVIFTRIKLNFLWALIYNILSIPIAAGVCYPMIHSRLPPTVAAIAMALSSISVVGSSLALRLYQPPKVTTTRTPVAISRPTRGRRRDRYTRQVVPDGDLDLTEPLLECDTADVTEKVSNTSTDLEEGGAVIVAV